MPGFVVRRELPALFWAIVALVVLLPLPLGAVYQWSWGLMACVVGAVLVAWSARVATGRQEPGFGLTTLWLPMLLFGLTATWILLQALPITPHAWHHPLWETAIESLGREGVPVEPAVSLNPYESLSGLARLIAYAGIFWIGMQYCRRAVRARQVLLAVTYAGFAYAVYGLAVYVSGSETILVFRKVAYLDDLTSTFVNRNSYATYAGIALVCTTGLVLVLLTQALEAGLPPRERIARLLDVLLGRGWPLLAAWVLLMVALVLSHSRAGFLSTLLGLLVLLAAAGLTRAVDRRLALGFAMLCAVGLIWVLGIGGGPLLGRLLQTSLASEERPIVYERTLSAIGDSGAFGTGFGTFEEAFRFYRTSDIQGNFNMAHNTYLENVLELGVPAAGALFAIFLWFAGLCALGIRRRRRDAVYPCVGMAVTTLVAAHSSIDFSMQIPAIAATYALIMGAACAQCWSSRRPADPW
jgi:O-antigen ligase